MMRLVVARDGFAVAVLDGCAVARDVCVAATRNACAVVAPNVRAAATRDVWAVAAREVCNAAARDICAAVWDQHTEEDRAAIEHEYIRLCSVDFRIREIVNASNLPAKRHSPIPPLLQSECLLLLRKLDVGFLTCEHEGWFRLNVLKEIRFVRSCTISFTEISLVARSSMN
jgi:hypothetical protein